MITEDYVSFEVAKLLKEKGFNELTPLSYSLPYGYESHIPCCNLVGQDPIIGGNHHFNRKYPD